MKVSELSKRSGVSVASIKYYLREGLLAAGQQTAANQADYGEHHVRRLQLIRSLMDVGGLSISRVRATLAAVEDEATPMHDAFGAVMHGLGEVPDGDRADGVDSAFEEVQEWLASRRWRIAANAPAPHRLAELLATLRRFDFPISMSYFDDAADYNEDAVVPEVEYARAMADRTAAVETMLIGTVVIGQVMVEIRRLALEAVSFRVDAGEG